MSAEILRALATTVQTPKAAITMDDNTWNGTGAATAITANTEFIYFYVNNPAFVVATGSLTDPAQDGARFAAGETHILPAKGKTHLHIKNGTAGSNVKLEWTEYGGATYYDGG